jgi:hypothetical protein
MKTLHKMHHWLLALTGIVGFTVTTPIRSAADVTIHIGVGAPAPAPVVYQYVYYPEAEVYFVPETRVYWWFADGVWVTGPAIPVGIELGSSVQLRVDAPEPWRHHEVIVKRYPGHRHNKSHERDRDRRQDHDRGRDHDH